MMPDGIPLAEGAEDRDGLEMDELHLPLGPVLAHWPPGLVLTVTLHGDVVVAADVEQLTPVTDPRPDDPTVRAARLLDAAGAVLSLAGLPAESARVAALRDRCLDGELEGGSEVTTLGQRVARRRALRWVLGGLSIEGVHGGTETLHDRLLGLFEEACAVLEGEPIARVGPSVAALPALVSGWSSRRSGSGWQPGSRPASTWPRTRHGRSALTDSLSLALAVPVVVGLAALSLSAAGLSSALESHADHGRPLLAGA